MNELPFVTVVIPTRDRARLVTEAVQSVVDQDYPDDKYEVVVVDDGSTDETVRAVQQLYASIARPPVRLVRQAPRNQNAARNRGIKESHGPYLAFFDDDEIAPAGWLTTLVTAAQRLSDAACVGGPYRVKFEGRQPRLCPRCWPGEAGFDLGSVERYVGDVAGGNMIVQRQVFDSVGVFDESLQGRKDETEWMLRLTACGGRVGYAPEAWVWHRRTSDQLRLSRRFSKAFAMGQQDSRFLVAAGREPDVWDVWRRLGRAPRLLGHATRRRCSEGLMQVAIAVGFAARTLRAKPLIGRDSLPL